jgi:hypothetical protein
MELTIWAKRNDLGDTSPRNENNLSLLGGKGWK